MENKILQNNIIRIGDTVKLIDQHGGNIGYVGDMGTVMSIDKDDEDPLVKVCFTTGGWMGRTSSRYAFRWERISEWDR